MSAIPRTVGGGLLFAGLALCLGCGPKIQKAGGKVLVNGVPVKDGTVMFYPVAKGRPATSSIATDGTFTLSYGQPGDGLPVGDYKVAIISDIWKEGKKTAAQEYEEAMMKKNNVTDELPVGGYLIHIVPPEYNNIETTPLTQTVVSSSDPQQYVFDIPSKKK